MPPARQHETDWGHGGRSKSFELPDSLRYDSGVFPRKTGRQAQRQRDSIETMNETQFQLTRDQKEMLLRGLRFVRSSVALDTCDFSEDVAAERESEYAKINRLQELLDDVPVVETAAV